MAQSSKSGSGIISGINVTPLVDITLVLLIVFIVTAKLIVTPAVPLDLPPASQSEGTQVVFSVVIDKESRVTANGAAMPSKKDLTERARDEFKKDPSVRVVINADGSVPHRKVIEVLDSIKSSGISKIAFGTSDSEGSDQ